MLREVWGKKRGGGGGTHDTLLVVDISYCRDLKTPN